MSKIRDTDYLTISARVRAMENRLVTRERMERMVEARSDDEAVKVLTECGYEELPALTNRGLDELLSAARAALYRELGGEIITVGTDAHIARDAGLYLREGYDLLRELGFRYVTVFQKRRPEFIRL